MSTFLIAAGCLVAGVMIGIAFVHVRIFLAYMRDGSPLG